MHWRAHSFFRYRSQGWKRKCSFDHLVTEMVEADIEGVSVRFAFGSPFRTMLTSSLRVSLRAGPAQQPGLSCSRFLACTARLHSPACHRIPRVLFRLHTPPPSSSSLRFPFFSLLVVCLFLFSLLRRSIRLSGYYRSRVSLSSLHLCNCAFTFTPSVFFWRHLFSAFFFCFGFVLRRQR